MKPSVSFDKMKSCMRLLLATVFLILLWLPTLDSFFDLDKAPWLNEKREPATFPENHAECERSCAPFRPVWRLTLMTILVFADNSSVGNKAWKHDLFKEASSRPDVMIGRDGWLFFTGKQMIENYRGVKTFTPGELQNWQTLLEKRRDWLARRGIKYLCVIPPDKHSIYPEYLPAWMTKVQAADQVGSVLRPYEGTLDSRSAGSPSCLAGSQENGAHVSLHRYALEFLRCIYRISVFDALIGAAITRLG